MTGSLQNRNVRIGTILQIGYVRIGTIFSGSFTESEDYTFRIGTSYFLQVTGDQFKAQATVLRAQVSTGEFQATLQSVG